MGEDVCQPLGRGAVAGQDGWTSDALGDPGDQAVRLGLSHVQRADGEDLVEVGHGPEV